MKDRKGQNEEKTVKIMRRIVKKKFPGLIARE